MTAVRTPGARPSRKIDRTPEIDPRLEERREHVNRGRRQRRRNRIVAVVIGFLLLIAGFWLVRSPLLDVDRVRVMPTQHTDPDEVLAASGLLLGDQMIDVNLSEAEESIEAIAWVADARVTRRWPGTLAIAVTERHPVAQIATGDGRWFQADRNGRILTVVPEAVPHLLTIDGIVQDGGPGRVLTPRIASALRVAPAINDDLRQRIVAMKLVGAQDIELLLRPSGRVVFGTAADAENKIISLETMFAQVDLGCLDYLDITVPVRPVLKRLQACQ